MALGTCTSKKTSVVDGMMLYLLLNKTTYKPPPLCDIYWVICHVEITIAIINNAWSMELMPTV